MSPPALRAAATVTAGTTACTLLLFCGILPHNESFISIYYNHESIIKLHHQRNYFCYNCRDNFPLCLRVVRWKSRYRALLSRQWVRLGAYEINLLSHAVVCISYESGTQRGVSLHYLSTAIRCVNRYSVDSRFLLHLFRHSGTKYPCIGHCHLCCKYIMCFYCRLQAYSVLLQIVLFTFPLEAVGHNFDNPFICLLPSVYL